MSLPISFSSTLLLLSVVLTSIYCSSCSHHGETTLPDRTNATMDLALDTAGERMFYRGTALIPRGFNSDKPFDLRIRLAPWGNPPANETSREASAILAEKFDGQGRYQPGGKREGKVTFAGQRLQLRGVIRNNGKELDGEWFLDGVEGGGFRIMPEGYLFPGD